MSDYPEAVRAAALARFEQIRPHLEEGVPVPALALRVPQPSAATVHRQVVALAPQQGWPVPSYSSVYAVIRHSDPGLRTLALDGAKQYQETYDLLYRREASRANEMWQADHTPSTYGSWILTANPADPG